MKHEEFFEKNRYTKEEAETEAEKLHDIAGKNAPAEDYKVAEQMVEDENIVDFMKRKDYPKEKIFIMNLGGDKNMMIALDTEDRDLYRLFNSAAHSITKKYQGFHQIGSGDYQGFTAWEIWNPKETHLSQIVDEIYAEMHRMQVWLDKQGE